jgi:hypothetical protein
MMDPRSLPPAALIECEPIRSAMENYAEARDAALAAKRQLIELERGRAAAERQDAQIVADALERVGRPPQPSGLAEHDAKTAAARLKPQACAIREQRALAEFEQSMEVNGAEWRSQLASARPSLLAEKDERIDELVVTLAQLRTLLAIQGLVHGQLYNEAKYRLAVPAPPNGDYDTIQADWLLAALHEIAQPPALEQQPDHVVAAA